MLPAIYRNLPEIWQNSDELRYVTIQKCGNRRLCTIIQSTCAITIHRFIPLISLQTEYRYVGTALVCLTLSQHAKTVISQSISALFLSDSLDSM